MGYRGKKVGRLSDKKIQFSGGLYKSKKAEGVNMGREIWRLEARESIKYLR